MRLPVTVNLTMGWSNMNTTQRITETYTEKLFYYLGRLVHKAMTGYYAGHGASAVERMKEEHGNENN